MSQKEDNKHSEDLVTPRKDVRNSPSVRTRSTAKKKQDEEEVEEVNLALENKLQECAKNMHLSPIEVRKIIKKIVGNEHILALVKLQEEDDEKKKQEEETSRSFNGSPTKLTRAKMKALNRVDPMLSFVQPLVESEQPEPEPEVAALTEGYLHSDEEDEEYEPKEDEFMSDDDPNCTLSDMDSNPRTPMTPYSVDCSPVKCATTPDGVFKVPKQRSISNSEREEIIAKRTRSKVSLHMIPIESIEANLNPPDVTHDMYELLDDPENKEWMQFLGEFQRPLDFNHLEEEDDDPVYEPLDPIPWDRDVNVSKKEIDNLLEEIVSFWDFDTLATSDMNLNDVILNSPRRRTKTPINLNESTDGDILIETINEEQLNPPPIPASIVTHVECSYALTDPTCTQSTVSTSQVTYSGSQLVTSVQQSEIHTQTTSSNLNESTQSDYLNETTQFEDIEVSLKSAENTFVRCSCVEKSDKKISPRNAYIQRPVLKYVYNDYVEKYKGLKELPPIEMEDFGGIKIGFTERQRKILEQQLRIYTQLTVQHFLQTFSHPKFWNKALQHKLNLQNIQETVMNTDLEVCNLDQGVRLIERWETELSEINEENEKHIEFIKCEMKGKSGVGFRNIMKFPPKTMKVILTEEVFLYPEFIPRVAFRTDEQSDKRNDFAPSELMLFAIGLEQFLIPIQQSRETNLSSRRSDLRAACERIAIHLNCGKTPRRIQDWIKMNSKNELYNPIQYFFEHKRAPPVLHEILYYPNTYGTTLKDRLDELPENWRNFSTALNTVEIAKFCGNKSISEFVTEISEIPKQQTLKRRSRLNGYRRVQDQCNSSPTIVVNINYIFPEGSSEKAIYSNILPETPSSANFVFDWNNGKLRPEIINFNESRFSEISNESISNVSFIENVASTPLKVQKIITKEIPKPKNSSRKRRTPSLSPALKKRRDNSRKNAFAKFIVDYRWNTIHKVLRIFKNPILHYVAAELKALELYTDLLEDLKMNCKKNENISKRIKDSEDDSIPKSRKAARMEENFRQMLMPESKEETNRKDELYALNFFDKVEETFKTANKLQEFEQFEEILRTFDASIQPVSDLYKKIESLFLPDYPDLAEAFLVFLQPHQAAEVGKFYEHFIVTNMRTFINKLNIYFNKQPAQIRKILNTLSELSDDPNITMEKVKAKVLPLLKGNQFLTDWFLETFPSEKVPESLINTPEVIKLKEIEGDNNDNYEIIPYSELISDTSENQSQSCQTKYINGRIFYGSKILLPAKLTFIAEEHTRRLNSMIVEESESIDHIEDCVHGVREYGENRLRKLMSGDNDSTTVTDEIVTNDLTIDQICDDNELKNHAIRLNPTLYSTASSGNTSSEPLSPKKQITRNYERRKSPKKSVIRSPVCSKKPADSVPSTSPAISVARKIKDLIKDKPSCSKDILKQEATDLPSPMTEVKVESKCWTRDEDKIILEEIRGNSNEDTQKLIENISGKLATRTSKEIQDRHKFLMDVLSKLQSK